MKKSKRIISLFIGLAILITALVPSAFATPIEAGDEGYMSLHTYASKTNFENIFKISMEMDIKMNNIESADIVFIIDNSGSMGMPDDQTPLLKNIPKGLSYPAGVQAALVGMNTYNGWYANWTTNALPDPETVGAWEYGEQHYKAMGFASDYAASYRTEKQEYRFEWMKKGLLESIEAFLNPEKNGAADLIRVAVFSFGSGRTDNTGTTNNVTMSTAGGFPGSYLEDYYDWGNMPPALNQVWALDANLNGVGTQPGNVFTSNKEIVYRSGVGANAWKTPNDLNSFKSDVNSKLVRRDEGTSTAAGLHAAYDLIKNHGRKDAKKYVFLLSDGMESTKRNGENGEPEFSEALALASNMKKPVSAGGLGVEFTGVGLLDNVNSQYQGSKYTGSSLINYLAHKPVGTNMANDPYAGETHFLRTIAPLGASAESFSQEWNNTPASRAKWFGSDFMELYYDGTFNNPSVTEPNATPGANNGYEFFVNDIKKSAQINKLDYTQAPSSAAVLDAFRKFVAKTTAADKVNPQLKLSKYFKVFDYPGAERFKVTGAATSKISVDEDGRNIKWDIGTIKSAKAKLYLEFYVEMDESAKNEGGYLPLFDYLGFDYLEFGDKNNLVSKSFPNVYIHSGGEIKQDDESDVTAGNATNGIYDVDPKKEIKTHKRSKSSDSSSNNMTVKHDEQVKFIDINAKNIGKGKIRLASKVNSNNANIFQWQMLDDAGNWQNILGANSSIYDVSKLKNAKEYTFRCIVTNSVGVKTISQPINIKVDKKATGTIELNDQLSVKK